MYNIYMYVCRVDVRLIRASPLKVHVCMYVCMYISVCMMCRVWKRRRDVCIVYRMHKKMQGCMYRVHVCDAGMRNTPCEIYLKETPCEIEGLATRDTMRVIMGDIP